MCCNGYINYWLRLEKYLKHRLFFYYFFYGASIRTVWANYIQHEFYHEAAQTLSKDSDSACHILHGEHYYFCLLPVQWLQTGKWTLWDGFWSRLWCLPAPTIQVDGSEYISFIEYVFCKYFIPICGLLFCSFFFSSSLFLRASHTGYGSSWLRVKSKLQLPAAGLCHSHNIKSEPLLQPTAQLWQCWSLTHWVRPGIEPASSQTLCQVLNPLIHNRNSCIWLLLLV